MPPNKNEISPNMIESRWGIDKNDTPRRGTTSVRAIKKGSERMNSVGSRQGKQGNERRDARKEIPFIICSR